MSQPDRIEFITELVTPLAASLGLAVWGVELGGAARPIARIYVDVLPGAEPAPSERPPTTICSRRASPSISARNCRGSRVSPSTVEDPFATNWTLEISSPGSSAPSSKSTS